MFPCEMKEQPAQHALTIRFHAPIDALTPHFERVYTAVARYLDELGEQPDGVAFAVYYSPFDMDNQDIEAGFPVAKPLEGRGDIQAFEIPAGMYAVCHYTGAYDEAAPAYDALEAFAREQGYQPTGNAYEWYLNDPTVPPEELKTDIAFPVRPV